MHLFRFAVNFAPATREYRGRGHLARLLKNVMERETSARRLPPARRSAVVYLQRRVAICVEINQPGVASLTWKL